MKCKLLDWVLYYIVLSSYLKFSTSKLKRSKKLSNKVIVMLLKPLKRKL
ncbi:hypothetical protein LMANV2_220047 [Leptospira interrogans serovar Manilae]|uniref:Uncharacterized protein n=1 Tax=Leptospira interrogans serovar Manilae TaxID=214675 RepID=A0AAQ1SMX4_LEPIR|nr:hypothetical protein LMANV2_220047 [Leptospira interrogans serovar Manilae]